MFSGGEVSTDVILLNFHLVDPAVAPGYSKNTSLEHENFLPLDPDTLGLEHGTLIFIIKTLVKGINIALQKLETLIFIKGYQ